MARKRHKPEEIVSKLRQVDVLTLQGKSVADAIRAIGVTEVTYYRWRQEFGGPKTDQVKKLKDLEAENARLRRAVSDLTEQRGRGAGFSYGFGRLGTVIGFYIFPVMLGAIGLGRTVIFLSPAPLLATILALVVLWDPTGTEADLEANGDAVTEV